MEQEVIQKNNVLIAKFMGATVDKYGEWKIPNVSIPYQGFEQYGDGEPCLKFTNECKDWEMEYHKSWSWIMPVVEKIESLSDGEYFFDICGRRSRISVMVNHNIDDNATIVEFHSQNSNSKIEAIWLSIVEFIKKHNEQ